jgi:TPR repeat protein
MEKGEAHHAQGVAHWTATNGPENLKEALECFRKAADMGHSGAQTNLGTMLAGGQGAPRDAEQALSWFLRAANQGDAHAQFHLAVRYHRANMRGLTPDASEGRIKALMWFLLAAAGEYHKADEWCDRLRLDMTRDEVLEAERRAAQFVPCKEGATPEN